MFAYLPEEKILFSQDGFGLHLASAERFDDELPQGFLEHESAKYYGNILLPYSTITLKILNKVKELNWDLKTIAPNHGIIWLKNPSHIIELYSRWASGKQLNKALIIFDTMWGSTAQMASAIAEGLKSGGTHPVMLHLRANHRSDIATQLLDAGALIVGTPNLNGNMFPTVADVLTYISGLKPQNLIGAVFGSYGWNTKALEQVETVLKEMKVELVAESIKSKYVPDAYTLDQCKALGMKISEKLKEKVI
jgi:flavorubredoxin